VKIRFIHYFQISISIFLLTACVGTLNVQLEQPSDTPPVQTQLAVSGIQTETAPISTSASSKTAQANTSDAVISEQPHDPKSTDQAAPAGLSGYKNPVFNYDPSLAASTVVENRPAVLPSSNGPYWQVLPDRTQITLND
jgi:hypothetical protein